MHLGVEVETLRRDGFEVVADVVFAARTGQLILVVHLGSGEELSTCDVVNVCHKKRESE